MPGRFSATVGCRVESNEDGSVTVTCADGSELNWDVVCPKIKMEQRPSAVQMEKIGEPLSLKRKKSPRRHGSLWTENPSPVR